MYITILFHHSLDNDRSTVETSYFTVSFYRQKFYEILTYILTILFLQCKSEFKREFFKQGVVY